MNLETAVKDNKVMHDFESESVAIGADHCQKAKVPPIARATRLDDYGSRDCVNLSSSTAVSRLNQILLVNKPKGKTSFSLVGALRRVLGIKKIGHAGTLDPFATGVMVMLIGRECTKLSDSFLNSDKEYIATLHLGITTDSYDCDGKMESTSEQIPTPEQISAVLTKFQGKIMQVPPMFSAKKIDGKRLYKLARKGQTVERQPVEIHVAITLLKYTYPYLELAVTCSKGTYIRSLAHDIGLELGCGAHLSALERTRSGNFRIQDCIDGNALFAPHIDKNALVAGKGWQFPHNK